MKKTKRNIRNDGRNNTRKQKIRTRPIKNTLIYSFTVAPNERHWLLLAAAENDKSTKI